jgi:diguanylate cyclase (GGDEF)-like protein
VVALATGRRLLDLDSEMHDSRPIPASLLRDIRVEQIGQYLRTLPLAIASGFAIALIAVWVAWDFANNRWTLAWLLCLGVSTICRLKHCREFQRIDTGNAEAILRLGPRLRIGSLIAGSIWGSAAFLLFAPGDTARQMFVAVMLAGISAASVTSMASDRWAALLFQLPVVTPLAAQVLVSGVAVHTAMGLMLLLYLAFMILTIIRANNHGLENTLLRLETNRRQSTLLESEARYRALAETDHLTGLPNRHMLRATLPQYLDAAQRERRPLALMYLDIDNFKDINDSHGHVFGDRLLSVFADRLRECVRPGDFVARMGGDEFIVIASGLNDNDDAAQLAARIVAALEEPLRTDSETVHARASVGIGVFPDDGSDADELLKNADIALYKAKAAGRNTYQMYAQHMSDEFVERRHLEQALRQALVTHELFVEYQPLVDLSSETVVSLEALVRWRHPQRGLLPPATFVPIAERCGLEDALGEQVLRQVCQQLHLWQQQQLALLPVAVNVSPRQIDRGRLTNTIACITGEYDVDPALLNIEITESALMRQTSDHVATLEGVRRLGLRVSLDDFGTGYSSLAYLKTLPIDSLKIDRSFVRDMEEDSRDAAIVRAIAEIGRTLEINVIAEGVETQRQANQLRALGCQAAQGFFFYKPMSAADCTELLRRLPAQLVANDTVRLPRLLLGKLSDIPA